jgi:hypothetical protein
VTAILDAGALVAIDKRDRRIGAMLRLLHDDEIPIRTSAGVVSQVWRHGSRQANLARLLQGVDTVALDAASGRRVGELLGRNGTADVVDAHLATLVQPGDQVFTSDEPDVLALLRTRRVKATVIRV